MSDDDSSELSSDEGVLGSGGVNLNNDDESSLGDDTSSLSQSMASDRPHGGYDAE